MPACEIRESVATNSTQSVMRDARYHRVPPPFDIHFNSLIHGTTYNFDDDPYHNTILMLFQDQSKKPLSQPARATENQNQARKL